MPLTPEEIKRIKEVERDCERFIQEGRHAKAALNKAMDDLISAHQKRLKEIREMKGV